MKQKRPEKKSPIAAKRNLQFDLFSQFVTNDISEVSNTVEIWEGIPKYFFTRHQMEKLRTKNGHSDPYKWEYTYKGTPCAVKIQPALVETEPGKYKAYFPGISEELVEEALKKIFTDQQYGMHDPEKSESWVRFTLKMVQKELTSRGRSRSIPEIKHSIEVMSSCVLTIYQSDKEVWKGSILQDLVTVGREDYKADPGAQHAARLPLFISHSINKLEYRQFNYNRLMQCNEQLSRWIYKRLINRYKQASPLNNYHFMYTDLKPSGLLQLSQERDNRQKVQSALKELKTKGVLMRFESDVRKEGRKIVDVKYTLYPSQEFVKEQKAAGKRLTDSKAIGKTLEMLP